VTAQSTSPLDLKPMLSFLVQGLVFNLDSLPTNQAKEGWQPTPKLVCSPNSSRKSSGIQPLLSRGERERRGHIIKIKS